MIEKTISDKMLDRLFWHLHTKPVTKLRNKLLIRLENEDEQRRK